LIDTDVLSELRKRSKANPGVRQLFARIAAERIPVYLSVVTIGELRRGVELIRHRGDLRQAQQLETWLENILRDHADHVLPLDADSAQVWGRLRKPHPENALDKQIAATALTHDLTVVTRNQRQYAATGAQTLNPFTP
jgi:toxin FitB